MEVVIWVWYGLLAFVALLNAVLMPRPMRRDPGKLWVGIPARDEADNLRRLIPELCDQGADVLVFDDDSSDGTGDVARQLGADVIVAKDLPEGWTGKNRACHELGMTLAERTDRFVLLDADVRPGPEFIAALRVQTADVVTGFPRFLPGRFGESLVFAWVPWILLATNPFGLVARVGKGHNGFTNGQIVMWSSEVFRRIRPHEAVRGAILEDVKIGRLLAKERIPVKVLGLADVFAVQMYASARQALDGMSKNSVEIASGVAGTLALAALLLATGWAWLLEPAALALLVASKALTVTISRQSLALALAMPIVLTVAAFTLVRSIAWRMAGKTAWKGRTYS